MRTATVTLKSAAPYSQRQAYERGVPKLEKEKADDYEARTWRNAIHFDSDGIVFIPSTALKNCLADAAKYLSIQIPGKGKATYTKHFEAGVLVPEPLSLGVKVADVQGLWRFVPADGKPGSGRRVWKCFGVIPSWEATGDVYILDETITKSVFETVLGEAGKFIGMGVWRPRRNGNYGRFEVTKCKWQ